MTILDNWGGFQPVAGGDRVGLGEVAFEQVPEPSSSLLALSASAMLLLRRKRSA
ncbi:MAG: PEP-CTERM sorting domain-containing protein [Akkermansiaceae bacterium]